MASTDSTGKRTPGSSNPATDVNDLRRQADEARNGGDTARAAQLDEQVRQAETDAK
jgi:hypothetical protein